MAKRVTSNRIKKNQTYSIIELAEAAMVSQITVRRWIKDGMATIDDHRPALVMGFSALDFLGARQAKAKQPMQTHQFYCLRCKAPKSPMGMMLIMFHKPLLEGVSWLCAAVVNAHATEISAPINYPSFRLF